LERTPGEIERALLMYDIVLAMKKLDWCWCYYGSDATTRLNLLADIAHGVRSDLTNNMSVVKTLKKNPEIWSRLVPYLDQNCYAVRNS
jgi:hypothetical protein